ncbi:MAG: aminodeoxychorismate synthase component I [Bacteroidales bacterium]|nr:aminodeoxychorismate synthase component I [Bacteroidales bacterium]MBN2817882.1 aminodeoxychorismate synthase component I [Bacteroidales bacterium]
MYRSKTYSVDNIELFKKQITAFFASFQTVCILDSHSEVYPSHNYSFNEFDCLYAAEEVISISSSKNNDLKDLDNYFNVNPGWLLGYLTYDIKNTIENLKSENPDYLQWPDFYFFQPKYLVQINKKNIEVKTWNNSGFSPDELFKEINSVNITGNNKQKKDIRFNPRLSKNQYTEKLKHIHAHIARGDIYEVNFCQEFYAYSSFNPFQSFIDLANMSPAPFSTFFRLKSKYLVSASPERYLKKHNNKIISQPIKGTARRGNTPEEDKRLVKELLESPKDRAENIMIVDLVRNDLSRIAEPNTVKVDELCGVYSFRHVHQLISTVSAESKENSLDKIFRCTFPMGSMTGAPKVRAMQIAEEYESTKRGLYSGAVGYITPEKDFDFNVVIRSLQYNAENEYLSFMVGGAITFMSDDESEYEECLVKAASIEKILCSE